MATEQYDVAVLGGGPGGYVAGIRLGQQGKKVVVIERENLGGVCLNWGCIPSKAIIHVANVRGDAHALGKVFSQVPSVDATAMQAWKDRILGRQRTGIANLLRANKCANVRAEAKIVGPRELAIVSTSGEHDVIQFERLIIATGARVIEIPGFPFSDPFVSSAREAVSWDPIPNELVIIGGGIIGCELGMAYAKLGSRVTIVEMLPTILSGTDRDLAKPVEKSMDRLGIARLTGARAEKFERDGERGAVDVQTRDGGRVRLSADRVLVAVGFRPDTASLGLEAAGVKLDERGWIAVDASCRTNVEHIFAIGDVTGPPLLAHRASHMGEVAAEVIAGHRASTEGSVMPLGVFTDPEIAIVGLSEEKATSLGLEVRTGVFPIAALGRAATMGANEGTVKLVVDAKSDVILGVGITAPNANELIGEACLALEMGALAEDLALTVHAHPTLSEGLMEAAKAARGEALHIINRQRPPPEQAAERG